MHTSWRERWSDPAGKAVRTRVLEALRAGTSLLELAPTLWPESADGDSRPDLRGIDLRFQELGGAKLMFARLDEAQLDEAVLDQAQLADACLDGASLREAKLRQAQLMGVTGRGATFEEADLTEADLTAANLAGARFRMATLRGARLSRASVAGGDLMGADLTGAQLYLCDLEGAHLEAAVRERRGRGKRSWAQAAGFPTFEDALPSYRAALDLSSPRMLEVAAVCMRRSPRPALELVSLLHEPNWHAQLWGALAAIARGADGALADMLWERIDAFSFVVPQLAVAAYLVDERFHQRAHARLHGLVSNFQPHGKSIGAIAALHALNLTGGNHEVCRAAWTREDPEAQSGGKHASHWLSQCLSAAPWLQERWRRGAEDEARAE